jgi:exopolysaccharide production protein ExoQ
MSVSLKKEAPQAASLATPPRVVGKASTQIISSLAREHAAKWKIFFLALGLTLLSGVLQRITGGELQGDAMLAERSTSNYYIVFVGFAFYGWCGLLLIRLRSKLRISMLQWPLLALLALAALSIIWSASPTATFTKAAGLIGTTIFAVVAVSWCGLQMTLRTLIVFLAYWLMASAAIAVLFPGFSYHSPSEYYAVHAGLYKGFYYHKNTFALIASLGIVIVALAPKAVRLSGVWTVFSVGTGVALLALSGSAKTAFSVPAAIVAAWVLCRLNFASRILAIVALVLAGAVAYAYGLTEIASDYALSLVGRDPTFSARTDIWVAVIKFTLEANPILGGGYGGGAWESGLGTAVLLYVGMDPGHSHNGLVQVFAELGALGAILMCAYLSFVVIGALRANAKNSHGLMLVFGVLSLVLINSFAASVLMEANSLYWFVIFLVPYMLSVEGK